METGESANIVHQLGCLWSHLSAVQRRRFILVLALMMTSALAEVMSLGAVLPFLGVLISPESVYERPGIRDAARAIGIESAGELVLPLTMAFAAAAILAGTLRLSVLWLSTRLAFSTAADLSIDMYRRTLYQPYKVHLARNTSEVISGITVKTSAVATGIVMPVLTFLSSAVMLLAIIAALLMIDPFVAVVSGLGFGLCYGLIMWLTRRRLEQNGRTIASQQTRLFRVLEEGLGGIRDVLLDGTQPFYCEVYHQTNDVYRRAQGANTSIAASPRPAMEALGMALLALLAYSVKLKSGGLSSALPVLGALALAAQRLIPALQQGYAAWTTILGCGASLADILRLLAQPLPRDPPGSMSQVFPFRSAIVFDGVRFRYDADGPWVVDGLDLSIRKGERVAFVGPTGGGKSTVTDIFMGLLEPTEGRVLIDGVPAIGATLRAWQKNIAHVPQHVYLADASIAENIAFGVSPGDMDMNRVKQAARQAQLLEFIEASADGYGTIVGERGTRLSGGQRQRIGIARALYKQASVLVFDEATSALDNITEEAVMAAIEEMDRGLTIILIAHRLTTVRRCDRIFELQQGRQVASGSYEELLQRSHSFRALARELGTARGS